jgi:hypothetical protein
VVRTNDGKSRVGEEEERDAIGIEQEDVILCCTE